MELVWAGSGRELCKWATGDSGAWPADANLACPECGGEFLPSDSLAGFELPDGTQVVYHRECVGLPEDLDPALLRWAQAWQELAELENGGEG